MSRWRAGASTSRRGRSLGPAARALVSLIGLSAAGCASIATPRLPVDVAAALTDHAMRRLETDDMILYFPEGRQDQAGRFLERVEGCARYEKGLARVHNAVADQKMVVILPELAFNNAFVAGRIEGYETVGVVPTYNTTDLFMLEGGIPPDPAIIGCHEITHYVHLQQIAGFAWFLNTLFGQVYTPQEGLDPWFDEGLAVYYETKLQPGVGRLAWPFWHGAFAAGVAGHRINGGDLNANNRDFFGGNHYLIGSEFISFLAGRYGEQKLWDLIAVQARSVLFPLAINVRFWQAYDSSLSTLIDEFADDVAARNPVVSRPPGQRVLREVGDRARYGRAPDGTEALLTADHDQPSRLVVIAPDGRTVVERNLTDVVSPRTLVTSSPRLSGSPTFTADGKTVFFVAVDQGATYQVAKLLRYQIATDTLEIVHEDLQGAGGAISPDGARYVFPRAAGDHHDLTELDLRTGAMRTLAPQPPHGYVAVPRFSPDGRRLAATVYDGARFSIRVFDAASGASVATLPTGGGPVHEASWADDHRLTYVGTSPRDGRFQVYLHDLTTGTTAQVTQAPYLAFEPQAAGGRTVRFLNREGWQWTLDEVALPATPTPPPAPSPPPVLATPVPSDETPATPEAAVAAEGAAPSTAPTATAPATTATVPAPMPPAASVGLPPPSVLATERPAGGFDHLFVPSLVAPTTLAAAGTTLLGLVLSGGDRLERHRWTMAGLYQFEGHLYSGTIGYANRQLAPVTIETFAAQLETRELPPVIVGPPTSSDYVLYRRDRVWEIDAQRSFFGNSVGAGFALVDRYLPSYGTLISLYPAPALRGALRRRQLRWQRIHALHGRAPRPVRESVRRGVSGRLDDGAVAVRRSARARGDHPPRSAPGPGSPDAGAAGARPGGLAVERSAAAGGRPGGRDVVATLQPHRRHRRRAARVTPADALRRGPARLRGAPAGHEPHLHRGFDLPLSVHHRLGLGVVAGRVAGLLPGTDRSGPVRHRRDHRGPGRRARLRGRRGVGVRRHRRVAAVGALPAVPAADRRPRRGHVRDGRQLRARPHGSSSATTTPRSPSTSTHWPSRSAPHAPAAATTAGMPRSRACAAT